MRALWAGETVDYYGEFHQLQGARQEPKPLGHIPIVIGGTGKKTLALVRDHADWWNVHIGKLNEVDELRTHVGAARVSIQQMIALVPVGGDRDSITAIAKRRFAYSSPVIGTGAELVDHYGRLAERGIERGYTWFCDFAPPETIAAFGEEVIVPLQRTVTL